MPFQDKSQRQGLVGPVFLAYFILVLHVLLVAALAFLVLFFRGLVAYMLWIFIGGVLLIGLSAFMFYRKMKAEGRTLKEMLETPLFSGRAVEISVLGGMASFRIGPPTTPPALDPPPAPNITRQLQHPGSRAKELNDLAYLLESNLITLEEFNKAKQGIFDES